MSQDGIAARNGRPAPCEMQNGVSRQGYAIRLKTQNRANELKLAMA